MSVRKPCFWDMNRSSRPALVSIGPQAYHCNGPYAQTGQSHSSSITSTSLDMRTYAIQPQANKRTDASTTVCIRKRKHLSTKIQILFHPLKPEMNPGIYEGTHTQRQAPVNTDKHCYLRSQASSAKAKHPVHSFIATRGTRRYLGISTDEHQHPLAKCL